MRYRLPLSKILRGKWLRIAELQDSIMIEVSKKFDFILHGGIAVWRVYSGKRFSYDIDIYHDNPEDVAEYFSSSSLFKVLKSKVTPSKVLYLKVGDDVVAELEASPTPKGVETVESSFWLVDGSSMVVVTLTPESLLKDKVRAFMDRKTAKDLYDIFYLLDFCDRSKIREEVKKIVPFLKSEPKDFSGLPELILVGKPPSFEMIVRKVKTHAAS
ncbi:MAG: nucleotidyl transferase AbiEii/AbiGii toxin family protein [Crenarchaeota archaeon]|nr:nucleotidyl transferase AbiEii/AbiGii toxin family protein [Thermoproteota archaeon]